MKNKNDYDAACTVALHKELLTLQSACISLYGDIAKISVKDKSVIIKFKKDENYIREIQKNKYISEINTIFSTQPAVKISLDDYNKYCEAKTMIVSLTAQYIKDKLGLLTWGNGWKLNDFNW